MNFNQFLIALRARRKAFAITFAAVILAATAVALVVPKKYVSSASLLMDVRDEQSMTPGRMVRDRSYLTTQMELIRSGRVATQVARDLKLAQQPGIRDAWEKATSGAVPIDDWIAAGLLDKLRVDVSGGNVLTVQFSSSDPKHATAVANGFVKAYLDTALHLRTEPQRTAAEWFDGQLKGMRAQVSQAQTKLAGYQKAKGITFADERSDVEAARLTELSTQYLAAKNATYDAATRHKHATEVLAHGISLDAIPEVLSNAHIAALKVDLSRVEQRREQESTVLGENHPQYQRTVAEVAGLKEKIQVEMKKLVAGLGNAVEQHRKREDELKNAMEAQNQRVIAMKDYRIDLAVLTRDVENAQRAYDAVLGRYMQTKVDSAATSTNAALLTPAVEPLTPAQPKVGLITGLAVLIGGLLAAAVVFALETMDRRVRSRDDLETRLAVPSLGRLSRWQPTGGRLLPAPALSNPSAARALPHPW
jgi:succinoglycan biosynthesis transport protein ExoP